MPVFVAKNNEGYVESVVMARTLELANAYWQSQEILPHGVEVVDERDLTDRPVIPILKAEKIKIIHSHSIPPRTGTMELLVIEK